MRWCHVDHLNPGMVLARPLFDQHHRKLLAEGTMVQPEMIKRIKDIGFNNVFIKERGTENIEVEELVSVQSRQKARQALELLASKEQEKQWKQQEDATTADRAEVSDLAQDAVGSILSDMLQARQPVFHPGVYLAKDQLINHSTDVAILAMLIGLNFGFSTRDLKLLGRAALFHDVGMLRLDPELSYTHPLDYTEEQRDLYFMHPQMGAVLLEQDPASNLHVTLGVAQHHERQDGSGFPEGLKGSGEPPKSVNRPRGVIHRFAEIIAVANHFDNLVSGQVERTPVMPRQAVEDILQRTPSWFNRHISNMAVSVINVFPVGANVELRDSRHYRYIGYRGVVAESNLEDFYRPKVTFLLDSSRQRLPEPVKVDFSDDERVKLGFLEDLGGPAE